MSKKHAESILTNSKMKPSNWLQSKGTKYQRLPETSASMLEF